MKENIGASLPPPWQTSGLTDPWVWRACNWRKATSDLTSSLLCCFSIRELEKTSWKDTLWWVMRCCFSVPHSSWTRLNHLSINEPSCTRDISWPLHHGLTYLGGLFCYRGTPRRCCPRWTDPRSPGGRTGSSRTPGTDSSWPGVFPDISIQVQIMTTRTHTWGIK